MAGTPSIQEQLAEWKRRQEEIEQKYRPAPPASSSPLAPPVVTDRARRRFVLVTGINRYMGDGKHDLRGCVTDAERYGERYRRAGWEVWTLLDWQATAPAIVAVLESVLGWAEPGDEVGWVNSSHGTLLPDVTDPDGEVEAVACADALKDDHPDTFLSGCIALPYLARWVHRLPVGSHPHFISDSCHSGPPKGSLAPHVGTRSLLLEHGADYRMPRSLTPPPGLQRTGRRRSLMEGPREAVSLKGMRSLILAGCRSKQTSADAKIGGEFCGAFSHFLLEAADMEPALSVEQLVGAAERALRRNGYDQVPQAEGDPERLRGRLPWIA